MTATEIVTNNLSVWKLAYDITETNKYDKANYTPQQLAQIDRTLNTFEGWGRCRPLIDTNSEEYKIALSVVQEHLDNHFGTSGHEWTAKHIISQAQTSSLSSFYTPDDVVEAITHNAYHAFKELNGRDPQTMLDPSAGNGRFPLYLADRKMHIETCELDPITRCILNARLKVAQSLNPLLTYHADSERYEHHNHCSYDLILSNIPFGSIKVSDRNFADLGEVYKDSTKLIHTYYFLKATHQLNDGGILAFITSRGFLASLSNQPFRKEMLNHGNIVSIVRLPDNMFDTITVGSDLIIFHKTKQLLGDNDRLNRIFKCGWLEDEEDMQIAEEPNMILCNTELSVRKNQYGKPVAYYKHLDRKDMFNDMAVALKGARTAYLAKITPMQPTAPTAKAPTAKAPAPTAKKPQVTSTSLPMGEGRGGAVSLPSGEGRGGAPSGGGRVGASLFSMFLNTKSPATTFTVMADILANIYQDLLANPYSEQVRTFFRDAYTSLTEVMTYNIGKPQTLHSLLTVLGQHIPEPQAKALLTLEKKDSQGNWLPADIFFKPVNIDEVTASGDAHAALAASLNKYGKVDMPYMQLVSKLTRDELIKDLSDQLFLNPITGQYEEADRWLTGNVIAKAAEAKPHLTRYKNGELQQAEHAIAALEAARPAPLTFEDIDVQFGARWVPTKYYEDFLYDALKDQWHDRDDFNVAYIDGSDTFLIRLHSYKDEWCMKHSNYGVDDTVSWALNGIPKFTMKIDGPDGKEKTVRDEEKCRRATKLVEMVRAAWTDYVNRPENKAVRDHLAEIYNTKYNCEVRPKYDGSFQTFPDLHLENLGIKELYPSQKDCIWMLKRSNGGGGICWHEVGTGKTLIMCIASYEMKRIGISNKPMIIAMKANVGQVAETYRKIYPNAKLLYPGPKDFSEKNRKDMLNQIKNNDWDCIILSHDQFNMIPIAAETEYHLAEEEVAQLDEALAGVKGRFYGRAMSGLQKRRDNLRAKLREKRERMQERTDDVIDWDSLEISTLFIDESQQYKNCPFATQHTRVAGIGNPNGSDRAWKLLCAIRSIQYKSGKDLGAAFFSGTIISNSLTELYILFKYLRPKALAEQNITSFDSWAAVFCQKKTDYEVNVLGQIISKERFATYVNIPELSRFLAQITDYRTAEMCGVDRPMMNQQFCIAPPTPNQEVMLKRLVDFVNTKSWSKLEIKCDAPGHLDKSLMLCATNIARQISLDPRMLDDCATFGDEPNNKVRRCAENIMRIYRETDADKGTQFVFNDISIYGSTRNGVEVWNMQMELRNILVNEYGVPSSEVEFINNAESEKERLNLFGRMNRGEVRILMGSTVRLGTGVNAQQRAVAIHHLDIPWRPSDMEQRNGRAIRQGNWLAKEKRDNKVDVFIYGTEKTLDQYKFHLLSCKSVFLKAISSGSITTRKVDESMVGDGGQEVSYAELLAAVSGNNDLLEKAKVDAKILQLEKERGDFFRDRNRAVSKMETFERDIKIASDWIKYAKYDVEKASVTDADVPRLAVVKSCCTTPAWSDNQMQNIIGSAKSQKGDTAMQTAGRTLAVCAERYMVNDYRIIGECGGFQLAAIRMKPEGMEPVGRIYFYIVGPSGQFYVYPSNAGSVPRNDFDRAAHYPLETFNHISQQIAERQRDIDIKQSQIPALQKLSTAEWDGHAELANLKVTAEEIAARLQPAKEEEKPTN